jgi:hypothetical protein
VSEHTQGKLQCNSAGHGSGSTVVIDEYYVQRPGDDVAVASDIIDPVTCTPSEANARRLAACWNVCDGISTSVLELNATAGGIATLERQRDNYRAVLEGAEYRDIDGMGTNRPADSRRIGEEAKLVTLAIIAQRDELLSALEEVVRISDRKHDAWDRAHAAIAAAKGTPEPVEIITLAPEAFDAFEQQLQDNPLSENVKAQALLNSEPQTLDDLVKLGQTTLQPTQAWARKVWAERQEKNGGEQ